MCPSHSPDAAAASGGYVPYFYQAGLYLRYGVPASNPARHGRNSPQSSYDLSLTKPLFGRPERSQTVEQIIASGYFSIPGGDPVTAAISDKMHTSGLGLDDVISQVRQRYEIYHRNLDEIELGKCAAMNAIYHHEAYVGPPSSKQVYAKHKAIKDLYEQERTERTGLWKDVSRLRAELPESAQLYLAAHRKMSILAGDPGGAP